MKEIKLEVLELFSGIGGMHFALEMSGVKEYRIVQAIDINENANKTYKYNFADTKCLNNNIQKLKISELQNVNSILMSPPCQPFTRQGNFKDTDDRRCEAFLKVCSIIKEEKLPKLNFILMENVMGFEKSKMRDEFIASLETAGFYFREFILTPKQVGVANTRHRYYLIARRHQDFSFGESEIITSLPNSQDLPIPLIESYTDENSTHDDYLLKEDILEKRFQVLDICTTDSLNSMCFTKSYSRYLEGTGSVFCAMTRKELNEKIEEIEKTDNNLTLKKDLKLRFFSPSEVAKLMSFPPKFSFPDTVNEKQRYKLLGNSINCLVVSKLVKLMVEDQ